jgi:hypothetical protein
MKPSELVKEIGLLNTQYKAAKDHTDVLKGELDVKKLQLLRIMSEDGIKSQEASDGSYTATRGSRTDVKLVDEQATIKWLESQPNIKDKHLFIGLKWANAKPLVKTALKIDGEIVPGVEVTHDDSLTIKAVANG